MNANEIIGNYAGEVERMIKNSLKNSTKQYRDDDLKDLCQDVLLSLLEKPPEKIEAMERKGQLKFYIAKMCTLNLFSTTAPFFKRYIAPRQRECPIIPDKDDDNEEED